MRRQKRNSQVGLCWKRKYLISCPNPCMIIKRSWFLMGIALTLPSSIKQIHLIRTICHYLMNIYSWSFISIHHWTILDRSSRLLRVWTPDYTFYSRSHMHSDICPIMEWFTMIWSLAIYWLQNITMPNWQISERLCTRREIRW